MRVLVCLSAVPETTSKISFTADGKSLDTSGIQFVINPHDEFCLTKAVTLQEAVGAKVDVLSVGELATEGVLRKALAIGADEAIRIDADPVESFYVAEQIAAFIKETPYDLILMGRESIDYNSRVVPALVAGLSDYTFVNACLGLDFIEEKRVKIICENETGYQTLSADLPLVVAGQKGLVDEKELRIPNMRGIMTARSKPLHVVVPIDISPRTQVVTFEKTQPRSSCVMIDKNKSEELIRLLCEEACLI